MSRESFVCSMWYRGIGILGGNLLLESAARPLTVPFATTEAGMRYIKENAKGILPQLDLTKVIRSFGAVRPNLRSVGDENFSDFYIGN